MWRLLADCWELRCGPAAGKAWIRIEELALREESLAGAELPADEELVGDEELLAGEESAKGTVKGQRVPSN